MISLKRYIDTEHTSASLLRAMALAYERTLHAVGSSATQACPSLESDLDRELTLCGKALISAASPEEIDAAASDISGQLEHWAALAEQDLRSKTANVKELLVTLAQTAASVAASDAEHVMRFDALTARLERIASLDDVTELRSAVLTSAHELRTSVELMSSSSTRLKAMQSELTAYQTKLEAAEQMATQDPLTGLMNRRKIETAIGRRIERGEPFSVGLVDLDGFKAVNDRLGHLAGDDLLRQISADLKANVRTADAVGRWGGDEFVVVFDGAGASAAAHFKRLQQWVGGSYSLASSQGTVKVHVDLSIGVTEWRAGMSAAQLIAEADRRMYAIKRSER